MKHLISNARLIGTVTPAKKWYAKRIKAREAEIIASGKPVPCPCCDNSGQRYDRAKGKFRACVGCKGTGWV